MKRSIRNPHVRKAVYRAYKGQCFFTGRFISEDEMVIDHLIAKSKGGEDSFENFVLTFKDLNLGKSNKRDDELERMKWAVKNVYAPRARNLFNQLSESIKCSVQTDEENYDLVLKPFKTRMRPPENLTLIWSDDLFWAKDRKIEIFSDSDTVSTDNAHDIMMAIEAYTKVAINNHSDYCIDVWLTKEFKSQIKSIWYCVNGQYFNLVSKTKYYDSNSPDKWAYVYFTKHYLDFLKWQDEIDEFMEKIFDIEDSDEYNNQLRKFCTIFPPPEEYAQDMLK